jgi:hypothetical protein
MKILRALLRSIFAFTAVLIIVVVCFWLYLRPFSPLCGNEIVESLTSPDGSKKVVIFQRDCGATTGFSTQASLLLANEVLRNNGGNVFSSDTNHGTAPSGKGGGPALQVRWLGTEAVSISYHPATRISKAQPEVSGVQFKYSANAAK